MATLDLSSFGGTVAGKASVLGYSSVNSSSYGWYQQSVVGSDNIVGVTSVTGSGKGTTPYKLDLATEKESLTTLTDLSFGSSSDDWNIVGNEYLTSVALGSGADSLQISLTSASDLSVSMGNGDDYVSLGNAEGSATVQGGDGADEIIVTNAQKNLRVELGAGKDSVQVATVSGAFNVTGDGSDAKLVNLSSAQSDVSVELGGASGNDTVGLGSVSGALAISTGAGKDSVTVGSILEDKNGTIDVGDGNDYVSVTSASGNLTVTLGAGTDSLEVGDVSGTLTVSASGTDANVVTVNSASSVSITLGDGKDVLDITSVVSGSINLGAGKDTVYLGGLDSATLNGGAGNKDVSLGSASKATVTLGDGADVVSLGGDSFVSSTINLGEGNDSLNGTAAIIDSSTVQGGAGNDDLVLGSVVGSSIDLGDGDDFISLAGASDVTLAGGAGNDVYDLSGLKGNVALSDYDITRDVVSVGGALAPTMLQSDGSVSLSGGTVTLNQTGDFYAARVGESLKKSSVYGWAGEDGSFVNASSMTESVVLVGSNNENTVDTLMGGSKNDTIVAGGGDYVYGGAGNDYISLTSATSADPMHVGLAAAGGSDTVANFSAVSSINEGDGIYLFENTIADGLTFKSGTDTVAKLGKATLTLGVNSSNAATVKVEDMTGESYNVAVVGSTASISDVSTMANIYYGAGDATTLDFSAADDALVVDLGNTGLFENTGDAIYAGGFDTVKGGSDTTVLMGSAADKETLMAGTGDATLWGGGSAADVLDGTNGKSATDTKVTYFYTAGDGKDTIQNASWGKGDGNDVLYLSNVALGSITNNGTNTVIKTDDASDRLTLAGYGSSNSDTALKFTTDGQNVSQVKIGVSGKSNTWTYDADVAIYMGGTNNTLKVGSDVDSANIWLDGSNNSASYEKVKTVDASSSSGTLIIAGSGTANETLTAGRGETSLFGGFGASNDTMKSSTSQASTTFFFGKGDGSDVITSSYSDDKVVLYNVALADISAGNVTLDDSQSGILKIAMNDGSSLTIGSMSSTSVKTFQLSDGSTWQYDYADKSWEQA